MIDPEIKEGLKAEKDGPRTRAWTVMIYLAGDNNLSEDMVTALRALKEVGDKNDKINLLVRYDSVYPPIATGYYDLSAEQKLKTINKPIANEPENKQNGRATAFASQPASSITDFVKWAVDNYPADDPNHYVLVLSGHGDAFRGKTFLLDEEPAGSMSINELRSSLTDVQKLIGHKLAVLGFDSCAMNLLEINYELKDFAEFLVSSEGVIPKCGWAYRNVLSNLATKPDGMDAASLAASFVGEFIKENEDYVIAGRSVEMSVTRVGASEEVLKQFNVLVEELLDIFPKESARPAKMDGLIQSHFVKLIMYSHWKAQTFFYEQTVDLLDFCSVLSDQCKELSFSVEALGVDGDTNEFAKALLTRLKDVATKCRGVLAIAKETGYIVHKDSCGPEFQFAKGISLYFPWSFISLYVSSNIYKTLLLREGEERSKWMDFLERFTLLTARDQKENALPIDNTFSHFLESGKKTSPVGKTGRPGKDDMDTMKKYFSSFKNNWIFSDSYKPEALGEGESN